MNVAVLTLTRDRLPYTRHCFQTLRENAGCEFDWFVLDQDSSDGTPDWLLTQDDLNVTLLSANIGISRGLNLLLDEAVNPADYDCIVKVDNDCEFLTPGTLQACCEAALSWEALVSPRILGLREPPPTVATIQDERFTLERTPVIGGIFLAAPARVFEGYRHDERNPSWGGDDVGLCAWFGGVCGYLRGFEANHYLSTDGQVSDDPAYWDRKLAEMAA